MLYMSLHTSWNNRLKLNCIFNTIQSTMKAIYSSTWMDLFNVKSQITFTLVFALTHDANTSEWTVLLCRVKLLLNLNFRSHTRGKVNANILECTTQWVLNSTLVLNALSYLLHLKWRKFKCLFMWFRKYDFVSLIFYEFSHSLNLNGRAFIMWNINKV
jgi:hypothetical protein